MAGKKNPSKPKAQGNHEPPAVPSEKEVLEVAKLRQGLSHGTIGIGLAVVGCLVGLGGFVMTQIHLREQSDKEAKQKSEQQAQESRRAKEQQRKEAQLKTEQQEQAALTEKKAA